MSFTLEPFDMPGIPIVLREGRRALRKGGRIAVAAMPKKSEHSARVNLHERAHEKTSKAADSRPIYADQPLAKAASG